MSYSSHKIKIAFSLSNNYILYVHGHVIFFVESIIFSWVPCDRAQCQPMALFVYPRACTYDIIHEWMADIYVPRLLTNDLWVFLFQPIDAECVK